MTLATLEAAPSMRGRRSSADSWDTPLELRQSLTTTTAFGTSPCAGSETQRQHARSRRRGSNATKSGRKQHKAEAAQLTFCLPATTCLDLCQVCVTEAPWTGPCAGSETHRQHARSRRFDGSMPHCFNGEAPNASMQPCRSDLARTAMTWREAKARIILRYEQVGCSRDASNTHLYAHRQAYLCS